MVVNHKTAPGKDLSPADLAIGWSGLPPYAACCLREFRQCYSGQLHILATRSQVPHEFLESELGQEVIWLDRDNSYSWKALGLEIPYCFFHTGWAYPEFNSLGKEVRISGGQCVGMIDNIWRGTARQIFGLLAFRVRYRRWYSAVFVPGKLGRRFCRRLGMPDGRIFEGLYGASPVTFHPKRPLLSRPKRILFVGQLIERKGLWALLESVRRFVEQDKEWEFVVIGDGDQREEVARAPGIRYESFQESGGISEWMNGSRFLVLPSLEDNWGVVAHEAALCGCGLLLSDGVGARADLLTGMNGAIFKRADAKGLFSLLKEISKWSEREYAACFESSLKAAEHFGPIRFSSEMMSILDTIRHA